MRTLRAVKGNVEYRLPHRKRDGYDIKPAAVEEIAGGGASLIVTCDCGITALETAKRAREIGIDLIVTDHHEPGAELPGALAVVNPKRADTCYPFHDLAGVGVAFKFAQGVVRKLGLDEESFVRRFTDLAAMGTVGDVVPLIDENRAIVKHGLEAIPHSKKIGLKTILLATKNEGRAVNAYFLGYILGPRINAVGRMDDATAAQAPAHYRRGRGRHAGCQDGALQRREEGGAGEDSCRGNGAGCRDGPFVHSGAGSFTGWLELRRDRNCRRQDLRVLWQAGGAHQPG